MFKNMLSIIMVLFVFSNLAIAAGTGKPCVHALSQASNTPIPAETDTHLSFLQSLKFLKESDKLNDENIQKLMTSEYAQRMSLTREDLELIFLELRSGDDSTTRGIESALRRIFPNLADRDLHSTNQFNKELIVTGFSNQGETNFCGSHSTSLFFEILHYYQTGEIIDIDGTYIGFLNLFDDYTSYTINGFPGEIDGSMTSSTYSRLIHKFSNTLRLSNPENHFNPSRENVDNLISELDEVRSIYLALPRPLNDEQIQNSRTDFMRVLDSYFGDSFSKNLDAQDSPSPNPNSPYYQAEELLISTRLGYSRVENSNYRASLNFIRNELDNNRPVILSGMGWYEIRDLNTVYINSQLDQIDPEEGSHALVIVGYELDFNGKVKTLKMQNSYGEGFIHLDVSYFRRGFNSTIIFAQ